MFANYLVIIVSIGSGFFGLSCGNVAGIFCFFLQRGRKNGYCLVCIQS